MNQTPIAAICKKPNETLHSSLWEEILKTSDKGAYPVQASMKFHIFIRILHLLRVYYELTKCRDSSQWLDSSVGRALHRHRRGHGFESRSGLNFFQALISQLVCITAMINHILKLFCFSFVCLFVCCVFL